MIVQFKRVFSAAHRLPNDKGKCGNIHGHNYRVTVRIDANKYGRGNLNMVIPFDKIKKVVDQFDHKLLLAENDPQLHEFGTLTEVVPVASAPTTEFMADHLVELILTEILKVPTQDKPQHVKVVVLLAETDNISATAIRVKGRPQAVPNR